MKEQSRRKIVEFKPRADALEKQIREIAKNDRSVYFGTHARERMEERGITFLDAIRVLKRGFVSGDIVAGGRPGEWKCKVVANVKGSRDVGVVTIVSDGRRLFVKTVEWEDL
jgi:hypothetical protein